MNKFILTKNYAEALAKWHNTRSREARAEADHHLAAYIEQFDDAPMGVRVYKGADETWEVDMTRAEAMNKTPQEIILTIQEEVKKQKSHDLEGFLKEYGNGKWTEVEVDEEGDVGVRGDHIKGVLWLSDGRLETFLVWLNKQVHFVFLEAWAGGRN